MNPQGILPENGDADESGPLAPTPLATLDIESGLTSQRVIPDYELLRRVGRGSYGEVFLARNLTGSFVAVKLVARSTFDHDRPFEREFEGIKSFEPVSRSDPSQVAILHVGRGDGFFYYAMELADDWTTECAARDAQLYCPHTLREDLKRRGNLPVSECVEIGLALARALAHLHHHGLVHRDVKPSNVIFVAGVPKLADIGLMTSIDSTRSLVGTDGYAAPEGPGTPQADLYSLGKLLYEISTGCDRKQFPVLPPDITDRPDRDALIELNAIFTRACHFDPRDRYDGAEMMLAELELLQKGKSVKRKRAWNRHFALGRKAGLVSITLAAILLAGAPFFKQPPGRDQLSAIAEVNDLVEQGNFCGHSLTPDRLRQALIDFKKAVELDPTYVPAEFGLFAAYGGYGAMDYDASAGLKRDFRAAAARLRQIAPSSSEAHTASAQVKWTDWQFRAALAEARLATQVSAVSKEGACIAHLTYGFQLLQTGSPTQALREYQTAERIDPSNPGAQFHLGHPYFVQRRFDEALKHYQAAIDLEPRQYPAHLFRGRVFEAKGDFLSAIDEFERYELDGGEDQAASRLFYSTLREAARKGAAKGYWEKRLELALKISPPDLYRIATSYASLGEKDAAYVWLRKACEKKAFDEGLMFDLCWDHNDPEFQKIARSIGLLQ